jgi:hypothetical protein
VRRTVQREVRTKMGKTCASFCDGFCGMNYDEDDEDTWPTDMDEQGLCLGDDQDENCDEFYSENE